MRNLKWFDSLQPRDFDNGAVIAEIRDVFKELERCRKHHTEPLINTCQQCGAIMDEDDFAQFCGKCMSKVR